MWKNAENHYVFPSTCFLPWYPGLSYYSATGQWGSQVSGFSVAQHRTQFSSSQYALQDLLCPSSRVGLLCHPSLTHLILYFLAKTWPAGCLTSFTAGLWFVGPCVDTITLPQIVLKLLWSHCHEKCRYPDRKKDIEEAFGLDLSQRQTDIRTVRSLNQRTKCQVHLWRKRKRSPCWSDSQLYLRLFG